MLRRSVALFVLLALFAGAALAACGDDDVVPVDAGGAADTMVPIPSSVVDIPWLETGEPPVVAPALTPCPTGWREVGDPPSCEPFPADGVADCADHEAHFTGEPGCTTVGDPCPIGDFADGLPTDTRVVYVLPGATGGDGSEALPYGSLGEFSLGGLPTGTVIALGKGTHTGQARIDRGHVLWGACAEQTTLTTSVPDGLQGVVQLRGNGGELRNATVASSPRAGIQVTAAGAPAHLEGVVVLDVEGVGVEVTRDSILTARSLVVVRTRERSTDRSFGRALDLRNGASASLERVVLAENKDVAAFAAAMDTALTLTDTLIIDTAPNPSSGSFGSGVRVTDHAVATVERAYIANSRFSGLDTSLDSTLAITDVLVRDTTSDDAGVGGSAVVVLDGGNVAASRVLFERSQGVGLTLSGTTSSASLDDAVVRGTRTDARQLAGGQGAIASRGCALSVARARFEDNRSDGFVTDGAGTTGDFADVVVAETGPRERDDVSGRGVEVLGGSAVTLTRAVIEDNHEVAVLVAEDASSLTLVDATLRDTLPNAVDGRFGRGLTVQDGARADVTRALVERNLGMGVIASRGAATMTVDHLVVRDTDGRESDGTFGHGLHVGEGATSDASHALFERNREVNVAAGGLGSMLSLSDAVVRETLPRSCAATTCGDTPVGHGVGAYAGGRVEIARFVIADANVCGVHVAGGELDLQSGEVRGHVIGACIQDARFDVARLMDAVRYDDNETNLQTTTLPVPEPAPLPDATELP